MLQRWDDRPQQPSTRIHSNVHIQENAALYGVRATLGHVSPQSQHEPLVFLQTVSPASRRPPLLLHQRNRCALPFSLFFPTQSQRHTDKKKPVQPPFFLNPVSYRVDTSQHGGCQCLYRRKVLPAGSLRRHLRTVAVCWSEGASGTH